MEAINGWIKEVIFSDFKKLDEERPAYCLGYMTPIEYKQDYHCVNLVD